MLQNHQDRKKKKKSRIKGSSISRNLSRETFRPHRSISTRESPVKWNTRRGREREREQKSEETRRIESRKKIPIEAGKISKRGATSVPVELSSRGLESFPDARIRSAIPLALEYPIPPPSSSPSSPSSSPHPSTRNSTKILDPLHPRSFPEAAHLCPNTDLSPPSINSLGKHVTRGRLHPDTARKLPKVQRIPGTRQDCPFPPLTFRFGPLLHPCSVEKRKTGGTPRKSRRTSKKISLAWRYNNNK